MTLPSMPAMPGMSLPSISLPDWIPLGPYSGSAVATQQTSAHVAADSSGTAEQSRRELEAPEQGRDGKPAASSGPPTEASTAREHDGGDRIESMHQAAPAGSFSGRAENSSLPLSTHATRVHASVAECKADRSSSGHASGDVEQPGGCLSRVDLQAGPQSSSTTAEVGLLASLMT